MYGPVKSHQRYQAYNFVDQMHIFPLQRLITDDPTKKN